MVIKSPVEACTLDGVLTREWPEDTHFTAYEPRSGLGDDDKPYVMRLLHHFKDERHPAVYECFDDLDVPNVRMVALIGDLDDPVVHKAKTPARPEWRAEQLPKLEASGLAYYQTNGGYRTLATTDFEIKTRDDAEAWKAQYVAWCDSIEADHGLVLDRTCKDWTRLYRAPNVLRAGKKQRAQVVGDMPVIDLHGAEHKAPSGARPKAHTPKPRAKKSDRRIGRIEMDRKCPEGVDPFDHAMNLACGVPPAVQGESGHLTLFNLACDLVCGLGIEPDAAREILWEMYNPRCDPPWDERERKDFDRKVSEAQKCTRDAGYLLPDVKAKPANTNGASREPFGAAANNPPSVPIFLCSRKSKLTLMYESDELGHRPIISSMVRTRIRELGIESLCPITAGKRDISPDKIIEANNASFVHTAYAFAHTTTHYDRAGEGRVTIGYPRTPLQARFDADAGQWLRALGGEHYDRLAVWIASCDQRHINRLAACLILMGKADSGKSMFAHAVARMWGQTPPPLGLINVQFNADMLRCPILADEEAQLLGSKALSTNRFRDIIQGTSRSVERKGEERCELIGALRAVVSCNGVTDLRFTNLGGPAVIEALSDRVLLIDATDRAEDCKGPLARLRLPGDHRVDLDRIAGHMAWLCDTVTLPAERFLGAGGDDSQGALLAGHVAENADLWETFRAWLDAGAQGYPWAAHDGHLCVDPAALAIVLEAVGKGWNLAGVNTALAPFADRLRFRPRADTNTVRSRVSVLNADRVSKALDLDGADAEALAKKLCDSVKPAQVRKQGKYA